jgi:predicted transcriptional regulator
MGEINSAMDEIEKIQKAIEKRKNEIVNIIDKEIPEYIEKDLNEVIDKFHYCIAELSELEEGWFARDCEYCRGNTGPDGKIIGESYESPEYGELPVIDGTISPEDCECAESDVCKETFQHLTEDHTSCQIIEDCYKFNFFCCMTKTEK